MPAKSEILIADTAAFVRNVPLWEYAERIITVKDVVYEIKDRQTQRLIEAYPLAIDYVTPSPESVKFINDFTKKTGDYAVLSAADVKVLALAYETEVETHGSDHLRLEPLKRVTNTQTAIPLNSLQEDEEPMDDNCDKPSEENKSDDMEQNNGEEDDDGGWCIIKKKNNRRPQIIDDDGNVSVASTVRRKREEWTRDVLPGFYIPKEKDMDQELNDSVIFGDNEPEDDNDDGGWITPQNIGNIAKGLPLNYKPELDDKQNEAEEGSTVACITGDFAMQNVLHHIGLKVLGVDGKMIKDARTYTLRCFVCFKLCPDMSKLFCPKCGNRSLKRVSVTLNPDGTQNIWISSRRLNTRGMIYNLPKPRAGKHVAMPLLTADQRFPQQWAKKQKKVNVLDAGFVAGSSPFSTHDVCSRAATLGYRQVSDRGVKGQFMHAKIWKPKRK